MFEAGNTVMWSRPRACLEMVTAQCGVRKRLGKDCVVWPLQGGRSGSLVAQSGMSWNSAWWEEGSTSGKGSDGPGRVLCRGRSKEQHSSSRDERAQKLRSGVLPRERERQSNVRAESRDFGIRLLRFECWLFHSQLWTLANILSS